MVPFLSPPRILWGSPLFPPELAQAHFADLIGLDPRLCFGEGQRKHFSVRACFAGARLPQPEVLLASLTGLGFFSSPCSERSLVVSASPGCSSLCSGTLAGIRS